MKIVKGIIDEDSITFALLNYGDVFFTKEEGICMKTRGHTGAYNLADGRPVPIPDHSIEVTPIKSKLIVERFP